MDQTNYQMMGGIPPHNMHQAPPIFGQYANDSMSAMQQQQQQLPPDLTAHMFADHMLMEDTNEAKRRRIAKACDLCRKKKIRCDGKLPACTQCVNAKTECVFTQVEKKRQPPKGAKYIEGLEKRLGRMEHLLRLSGLLDEDDNGATDLGTLEKKLQERQAGSWQAASGPTSPMARLAPSEARSTASPMSASATTVSQEPGREKDERRGSTASTEGRPDVHEVEQLSEMMCSLVTNQSGETRYIGSSSGFSIFSPKGIQWINEKTGDQSFQHMISKVSVDDHKWTNWKPEVFQDLFQRKVFRPLPSKNEALSLLTDYFENFNCMLPLFHQPTFMHLVERQYSADPYQGSGWWASLNCALAIAHRLRVMSNLVPADEDDKAWGYLKNAMAVFTELTMRNTDLLSVQALLGMALFMQGTPNPQPAFLLIAAAIRLSHSIGLHRRGTGFNLNPIEIEQRKRVFWIAYMLDKDLCLRSGRPPAQDDDDMNVELPDADPEDNIGNIPLADGKGKMNLFRVMCEFTVIESKVYKRLYSTKATRQTDGELLNAIGELDQELEEWKDSIPIDFRPEHEIKASHTPLILHVVMLHFTYYNCLTTIHRMSIHHGYWTSRLSNYAIEGLNARALNPRVFSSAALCTAAARASISLLKYVPQGDFSSVWLILYFPVSALVTLFGNILQNPLDPRARSDTRLMNLVVTFLSMLGQEAEQGGVHRMLGVCSEFERIAKAVIEQAETGQSGRRKRKTLDPKKYDDEVEMPPTSPPTVRRDSWGPIQSTSSKDTSKTAAQQQRHTPQSRTPNNEGTHLSENHMPQLATPYTRVDDRGLGPSSTFSPLNGSSNGASPMNGAQNNWPATLHHQDYAFMQASGEMQSPQEQAMFAQNGGTGGVVDYDDNNFATAWLSPQTAAHTHAMAMHQPLLPQDLFSLPMSLDWNWAEMSGQAYPTVENGNFGNPGYDENDQ